MNQKKDRQVRATGCGNTEQASGLDPRECPKPLPEGGAQDGPEPPEGSSKNYFVMNGFRSVKQRPKLSPKTGPETEPGKSQSPKQGRPPANSESVPAPETNPSVARQASQSKPGEPGQPKPSLALVEIQEMFRNPGMDIFCGKPSNRNSEGSRSKFKLSNILSNDLSSSELQNSKFKMSADLSDNLGVKSRLCESAAPKEPGSQDTFPNSVLKNLIDDKTLAQNLSLPLQRKRDSGHFDMEAKKKSQSREKKIPRGSARHEGANSGGSSVSDDNLCRAFSVDKSCLNSRKQGRESDQMESFEDEERVVRTIKAEEERTLSLIQDEPEELDKVNKLQKLPARSKLQFKNKVFEVAAKKEAASEVSSCRDPPSAGLHLLGFSSYQVRKPMIIGTGGFKEASMFSTQESRPSQHNKSLNADIYGKNDPKMCFPAHEALTGLRIQTQFPIPNYHESICSSRDDPSYFEEELDFVPDRDGAQVPISPGGGLRGGLGLDIRKARRTSSRKSHPITNTQDFKIDIENIIDDRTTVMIKNIPNRYTKDMMMEMIDRKFKDCYNFFYLPIDFDRDANVGYAFLNFVDSRYIRDFHITFHGSKWPIFNSDKVCEISYARIQGLTACNEHFRYSSLMKQTVSLAELALQAFQQQPADPQLGRPTEEGEVQNRGTFNLIFADLKRGSGRSI